MLALFSTLQTELFTQLKNKHEKDILLFLLLTFFVLSCSKEEADMDGSQNKETENKEIKIILEAETSSQNIFALLYSTNLLILVKMHLV